MRQIFKLATPYLLFAPRALNPNLSARDTHSWIEIAIPLEDGTFNLLSIGKFTKVFPITTWEQLQFIYRTYQGILTIVDPNKFHHSRSRIAVPFPPLAKDQFIQLMGALRQDLLRAQKEDFVFQVQGDNCARWVQKMVNILFPNLGIELFSMSHDDIIIPFFIMPFIWIQRNIPIESVKNAFRMSLGLFLGALEGQEFTNETGEKVFTRLYDDVNWNKGTLELPAKLFEILETVKQRVSSPFLNSPL